MVKVKKENIVLFKDISLKEEDIIFIVSQPRSGSTYLQNVLSNNDQVNTCSEPWILLNFLCFNKPNLLDAKFNFNIAHDAFEDYLKKVSYRNFTNDQKDFVLRFYEPLKNDFRYIVDKTPRYYEILDEIVNLFPKSKIIILKRDPFAVVNSIVRTWNVDSLFKLTHYKRDILEAPAILNNFCEEHKNNRMVYSLKYEDLIENQALEVKKIYNWLGLTYNDSVLDTDNNFKFKGKYGDPIQNEGRKKNSNINSDLVSKKWFKNFISGYANYLGTEFLASYGLYHTQQFKIKRTRTFLHYLHMKPETDKQDIWVQIKFLLKELYYRIT